MFDSSTGVANYIIPISLTVGSMLCPATDIFTPGFEGIETPLPNRELVTGMAEDERGSYSSILANPYNELEFATVLHEFVSSLVRNSKDLDIDIVEVVNDHFWDLI